MLILIVEKGSSFDELGFFSLIPFPFSITFLFAPICDIYYFKCGKRKTYIIPSIILIGLLGLYLAEKIEGFIDEINIQAFLLYGIIISFLISITYIGTDGWLVNTLDECYYGLGAATMYIGLRFGRFIGFELFI